MSASSPRFDHGAALRVPAGDDRRGRAILLDWVGPQAAAMSEGDMLWIATA